jgi:hypothetical protein
MRAVVAAGADRSRQSTRRTRQPASSITSWRRFSASTAEAAPTAVAPYFPAPSNSTASRCERHPRSTHRQPSRVRTGTCRSGAGSPAPSTA